MAAPNLRFSADVGRYRQANGRFVSGRSVRASLDRYLTQVTRETTRLANDLRAGRLSLESWRLEMKRLIRTSHVNLARIARGGRSQMDAAANGRVGQIIRREYGFLERWVEQIKAGWVLDGRLTNRAKQYVDAAGETFEAIQGEEMLKRGMEEEANELDPDADHCLPNPVAGTQGCVELTALGFVPLGTLPRPRSRGRTCRRGCKCHLVYRRARTTTRRAA